MRLHWLKHYSLLTFEKIDSTNSEALRLASAGVSGSFVILARTQTGGRGQRGRHWISIAGNLHASILVETNVNLMRASELSFLTANAVYEAIASLAQENGVSFDMELKWPNDVLINGKKVAGILLESISFTDKNYIIAGIGINVTESPIGLEKPATCLYEEGIKLKHPDDFLDILMKKFDKLYMQWLEDESFAKTRKSWTSRAYKLNQRITIDNRKDQISGIFKGIDLDGSIMIEHDDGQLQSIHSGEIIMPSVKN